MSAKMNDSDHLIVLLSEVTGPSSARSLTFCDVLVCKLDVHGEEKIEAIYRKYKNWHGDWEVTEISMDYSSGKTMGNEIQSGKM